MASHEQYQLRVTAGHSYDPTHHQDVKVNTEEPIALSSEHIDAKIHIRVKDYRGFPEGSPSTSPYFSTPQHTYDRYSIGFSFTPKKSYAGHHLVFGNDFDHPIRDRLPPLFDKAFGIVKWWIDPGLDGDVYGDEPYLYSPLLSTVNVLRIGAKDAATAEKDENATSTAEGAVIYQEGAEGDGVSVRTAHSIPPTAKARQKHFLSAPNREKFEFEAGREYKCDFYNPYLDFNEFSMKLGYGMPVISILGHWDGQPLRYVLKDKSTDTELFVVLFSLLPVEGEQAADEGGDDSAAEKSDGVKAADDDEDLD